MTTCTEWIDAQADEQARECKRRLEAGEAKYSKNPWFAVMEAWDAGVREGERRAAERLGRLVRGERL